LRVQEAPEKCLCQKGKPGQGGPPLQSQRGKVTWGGGKKGKEDLSKNEERREKKKVRM